MRGLLLCVLVAGCAESGPAELAPSGPVEAGKGDAFCPVVPAGIAPLAPSHYSCGPLDSVNDAITSDVNRFWGSQVVACECGPDFPSGCVGAFSLGTQGYIYIGLDFVNGLAESGSLTPAQYIVAHEFGHEINDHFRAPAPTMQQRELIADCLAGYYLGSLVCRGSITERDIAATLGTACVVGDGTGDPIGDQETHGTCEQRTKSVEVGIKAYLNGQRPLDACAL